MSMAPAEAFAEQDFAKKFVTTMWRRKFLWAGVTVLTFMVIFGLMQLIPKTYQSVAVVAIKDTTTTLPNKSVAQPAPFDDNTVGTEIAIGKSVLPEVADKLDLYDNPEFNPALKPSLSAQIKTAVPLLAPIVNWIDSLDANYVSGTPHGVTTQEQQYADMMRTLKSKVQFTPEPRSRAINVTVTTHNNVLSANIANTTADLFQQQHLKYLHKDDTTVHDFFEARLRQIKEKADEAAAAVEQFRIAHGLITAKDKNLVEEGASTINSDLLKARSKLADLKGQWDVISRGNPEAVQSVLGSTTISRLREQQATVEAKLSTLEATYDRNSPALIKVQAELRSINSLIGAEVSRARTMLQQEMRSAQETVNTLQAQLQNQNQQLAAVAGATGQLQTLQVEAERQREIYKSLSTVAAETDQAVLFPSNPIRVISDAEPAVHPSFPGTLHYGGAFILAMLFATGFTMVIDNRRKGVMSTQEVRLELSIPPIAMLPMFSQRDPVTVGMFEDGIERIISILTHDMQDTPLVVLVTSAHAHEGKTTISMGLARSAKARGIPTLWINGDMRSKIVSRELIGDGSAFGLSDLLRGDLDFDQAVSRGNDLTIMPSGRPRTNPTRLLASRDRSGVSRLSHVVDMAKRQYQLVVIDAPPALIGADALELAQHADCSLVVAKWGETSTADIQLALDSIKSMKINNGVLETFRGKVGDIMGDDKVAGSAKAVVVNMADPAECRKRGTSDAARFDRKVYKSYQQRQYSESE